MKSRVYLWGLMGTLVIALGGCKAQQSAYTQAYETAQARSTVYQQPATPPPVVQNQGYERQQPAVQNQGYGQQPVSGNDVFQNERITVMDGRDLRQYSVVIGSFVNRTNAESLKNRMQAQGYSPVVAQNEKGMFRVIVATYDTRAEAAAQRDVIKNRYPDF